jgi:hypothetical protein
LPRQSIQPFTCFAQVKSSSYFWAGTFLQHYCTYFDQHYLVRGLALYQSLRAHAEPFALHILCLDPVSEARMRALDLPFVTVFGLAEFLSYDQALAVLHKTRAPLDFYFSCTPSLVLFLFEKFAQIATLNYVDADLFFFSSPAPIYQEIGAAEIAIIEHRFPAWRDHSALHGRFNVGLVYFKRATQSAACLQRWRAQCIEWCENVAQAGRFGDQKYLDEWPERYAHLHVLQHPGANVAPWNLARHALSGSAVALQVDGVALIFFHFHRFCRVFWRLYDPVLREFDAPVLPATRALFRHYARALKAAHRQVSALGQGVAFSGSQREQAGDASTLDFMLMRKRIRHGLSGIRNHVRKILRGDYFWL